MKVYDGKHQWCEIGWKFWLIPSIAWFIVGNASKKDMGNTQKCINSTLRIKPRSRIYRFLNVRIEL